MDSGIKDVFDRFDEVFQPSGAMANHLWEQFKSGVKNLLKNRNDVEFEGPTYAGIEAGSEFEIKLDGKPGLLTIKPYPDPDDVTGWTVRLESGTTGQSNPVKTIRVDTKDDVKQLRNQIDSLLKRSQL